MSRKCPTMHFPSIFSLIISRDSCYSQRLLGVRSTELGNPHLGCSWVSGRRWRTRGRKGQEDMQWGWRENTPRGNRSSLGSLTQTPSETTGSRPCSQQATSSWNHLHHHWTSSYFPRVIRTAVNWSY